MKIYLLTVRLLDECSKKFGEENLRVFKDLNKALSYENKIFVKVPKEDSKMFGYSYATPPEQLGCDYISYKIYEMELQE